MSSTVTREIRLPVRIDFCSLSVTLACIFVVRFLPELEPKTPEAVFDVVFERAVGRTFRATDVSVRGLIVRVTVEARELSWGFEFPRAALTDGLCSVCAVDTDGRVRAGLTSFTTDREVLTVFIVERGELADAFERLETLRPPEPVERFILAVLTVVTVRFTGRAGVTLAGVGREV